MAARRSRSVSARPAPPTNLPRHDLPAIVLGDARYVDTSPDAGDECLGAGDVTGEDLERRADARHAQRPIRRIERFVDAIEREADAQPVARRLAGRGGA